jgi:hypothetical protein
VFRGTYDAPGDDGAVGGCAQLTGAPPPQAIGKIQTATGPVTVVDASGVAAQVKVGDSVYRHDTIETGTDGAVGITFTDGTVFNLANNARMALNEFVCDGTSNSALFSLSKGVFAFIAGKVAKTGGLTIDTPFARIRGAAQDGGIGILTLAALAFSTLREIQAASRSDAFLDDSTITYKDSPHGTFEITTRDGRVIVADDPGETVVVDPAGSVTRIPNSSSRWLSCSSHSRARFLPCRWDWDNKARRQVDRAQILSIFRCSFNQSILVSPRTTMTQGRRISPLILLRLLRVHRNRPIQPTATADDSDQYLCWTHRH